MCKPLETGTKAFPIEFISQYVKNNKFTGFVLKDIALHSLDNNQSCRIILQHDELSFTLMLTSLRKAIIDLFRYHSSFSDANGSARKVTCQKTELQYSNGHYTFTIDFDDNSSMTFVCKDITASDGAPAQTSEQ